MKLPVEKQAASPFNQMVELGVPVRTAKAVAQMLSIVGGKTASRVVVADSVREARSMLCSDMSSMLKVSKPTPGGGGGGSSSGTPASEMTEEPEEDDLRLATDTVKLAYAVARNMGIPQDRAMMLAMYAHTRLL